MNGNKLRGVIATQGKKQKNLVELLNLTSTTINKKVRGITPFNLNEVKKVSEFLGLSNDEIVEIFIK